MAYRWSWIHDPNQIEQICFLVFFYLLEVNRFSQKKLIDCLIDYFFFVMMMEVVRSVM